MKLCFSRTLIWEIDGDRVCRSELSEEKVLPNAVQGGGGGE